MLYVAYNLLFITLILLMFSKILGHTGTIGLLIGICVSAFLI